MAPRFVVHIGPMKTGTTYLQRCIHAAREGLEAAGVCVPQDITSGNHAHRVVARAARNPKFAATLAPVFERLRRSRHEQVLITDEFLSLLKPEAIARLGEIIGPADVKVVYAVRRWSERIPSMCFQAIFEGGTFTLPEFFARSTCDGALGPEIDYGATFAAWAKVFGSRNICLFPYSDIVDRKEDVFGRFLIDVLGVKPIDIPAVAGKQVWASATPPETELLRILNVHQQRLEPPGEAQFLSAIENLSRKLKLPELYAEMETARRVFTIDDGSPALARALANMAPWSDKIVGGRHFFVPKRREVPYIAPDYLLVPGIVERIIAIHDALLAFNAERAARRQKNAGGDTGAGSAEGEEDQAA